MNMQSRNNAHGGRWRELLATLKIQLWALPAAISLAFVMLASLTLRMGDWLGLGPQEAWWLYRGDVAIARDLLATIVTGLMTMTSLVISMTFVVLTLSVNQLGPRLIPIFTGDRQIQTILGLFIGTVAYALFVLVSLDDPTSSASVPHYAVTIAAGLTFLCLLALLLYVHKIARSIIADVVIEHVAAELEHGLRDTLVEAGPDEPHDPSRFPPSAGLLAIGKAGYIQTIDYDVLQTTAGEAGAVLLVNVRPGDYLLRHGRHIEIRAARPLDEKQLDTIISAFQVGAERSATQDLEYAVRQLVETAIKALQPGSKEPFTVTAVIDKLGESIEMLICDRELPPPAIRDEDGTVRLVVSRADTASLIDAAFSQIRQNGADDAAVLTHLADMIRKLLAAEPRADAAACLLRELDKLAETANVGVLVGSDRQRCLSHIEAARHAHA